jgi:hypothetical protein
MGQPEDYIIEEDNHHLKAMAVLQKNKKLYRDTGDGKWRSAGWVTIGIDAVWVRIIFILLVWGE